MIYKKLAVIQQKLKAPKDQRNDFGKYNYRSAESILEAIKPLLDEQGVAITLNDELVMQGDRYYIKAVVTLIDLEDESTVSTSAFAREELAKKGMDGSQVTGASSSYARKYALNGLFAIDDNKDSDYTNERKKTEKTVTPAQFKSIMRGVNALAQLTDGNANTAITYVKSRTDIVIEENMTLKDFNEATAFLKEQINSLKEDSETEE